MQFYIIGKTIKISRMWEVTVNLISYDDVWGYNAWQATCATISTYNAFMLNIIYTKHLRPVPTKPGQSHQDKVTRTKSPETLAYLQVQRTTKKLHKTVVHNHCHYMYIWIDWNYLIPVGRHIVNTYKVYKTLYINILNTRTQYIRQTFKK